MFYTYILHNKEKDKTYTGHTDSLDKRVDQHNDPTFLLFGKNAYTKRIKGKWELVYKEVFNTRKEAKNRENELKSSRGRDFIRNVILKDMGR